MFGYFSLGRRRERLEDRLEDERGRLAHSKRFHSAFGKRASEVRMYERTVLRREDALARFLNKHGLARPEDDRA